MDNKKLFISGLTVAGFLATNMIADTATFAIAADDSDKQDKGSMKEGSCSGKKGSCSGMKEDKKGEKATKDKSKAGSCSGMKEDKKAGDKQGSCSASK